MEPVFTLTNSFSADLLDFFEECVFAIDFKEELHWISSLDSISANTPFKIVRDSYLNCKVAISRNIFAYINEDENSIIVVNGRDSKIINTIKFSESKIECICFSKAGNSLIVGGKDGVLSKWGVNGNRILPTISRHKDAVFFIKESIEGNFIVSVGYDRSIILFNSKKDKLGSLIGIANNLIKCGVFFKNERLLALGDVLGYLYIIDTNLKTIINKFQVSFTQLINISYYKHAYIFCLNDNGVISIVDFAKQEKVMDNFLNDDIYLQFCMHDNLLLLSTSSFKVIAYNLDNFLIHFENLVDNKNISQAYNFVQNYRFLEMEQPYFKLSAKFEADLLECVALVCSGDESGALEILELYKDVSPKSTLISKIINDISRVNEFIRLMDAKMIDRAMTLAQKYSILSKLKQYSDFEDRFSKIIVVIKELIKKGRRDDANVIIEPFKRIPAKFRIIQQVMLFPNKIDEALNSIKNHDYASLLKLRKEFQFINYLQEVKNLDRSLEGFYFKALDSLYALDISNCRKYIAILKNFREYNQKIASLESYIENIEPLISNI